MTSDENPEPGGGAAHVLGPLEFDRGDLVYYARCSCGHRFGPMAAVASLQAVFEHHRDILSPPGEPAPPATG